MDFDKEKFYDDLAFLRKNRFVVKDKEVVDATGIPKGNVSLYLSGKKAPSKPFLQKFYAFYGKHLNETKVSQPENPIVGGTILHVPVEAEAGFIGGELNPVYNQDLKQWSLPGFDEPGYSFKVKGESMYPTFKDGEIVITGTRQEPYDLIKREYVYVIVTPHNILIKRIVKKGEDSLSLISDNTDFKPIEVKFDEVKVYRARRNVSWDLSKKYPK